uniref:Uncharacterized protein n=1 Tax=viral metagenome TaxID=1070528 RepID=A0A6M3J3D7_9ZZZZ
MEVIAEKVVWDDVLMLRTIFNRTKRALDIFDIPENLYKRWHESVDEYWAVQSELHKYMSGEKIL